MEIEGSQMQQSSVVENTLSNSETNKERHKKEFIGLIQSQMDTYKKSTEMNIQLIADLRGQLEKLAEEKQRALAEKEAQVKSLTDANGQLKSQVTELSLKNECLETKVSGAENKCQ
jgi:hypothetical protein